MTGINSGGDLHHMISGEGIKRTDMYCTECGKNFIGELDFSIDGNHIIECPLCGHEHCRVIEKGVITSERWDSRQQRVDAKSRRMWKNTVLPIQTSVASQFIRDRWLNFGLET